mgnify:CR=1 FL=1
MSENDNECNYLDAMVGLHLGDCFEIIPLRKSEDLWNLIVNK